MRAVKFTLFSISAGIIQLLSFTLMNEVFHWSYWVLSDGAYIVRSSGISRSTAKVTFRSANNVPIAMLKVAAYYLVFTPLSTWGGGLAHRYRLERVCCACCFHAAELCNGVPV